MSIGSDSHCSVDLREELRILEYGQRLTTRRRAILGTDSVSVGRNLYCRAAKGGAQALGINAGEIAVGKRADFTLIDPNHPTINNEDGDRILDRLIFANIGSPDRGSGDWWKANSKDSFPRAAPEANAQRRAWNVNEIGFKHDKVFFRILTSKS